MKITRIYLKNLNSLRGEFTIDLEKEPFASSGIFAITGPTGAGKSTILDAITLALYGRAARYDTKPNPENMMSRGTGECHAEVDFEVAKGRYKAVWQMKRARGKADGKLQPPQRYVYDSQSTPIAQNISEADKAIKELTGLDVDRFFRSVLLAQGDFVKFLKATPDDRATLLESLTGTAIYSEISMKAHEESTRRANNLKLKENNLENMKLFSQEERALYVVQIEELQKKITENSQELSKLSEQISQGRNLEKLLKDQGSLRSLIDSLEKEKKVLEIDLQRLNAYKQGVAFFAELRNLDQFTKSLDDKKQDVNAAEKLLSDAKSNLRECLDAASAMLTKKLVDKQELLAKHTQTIQEKSEKIEFLSEWLTAHQQDDALDADLSDIVSHITSLSHYRTKQKDLHSSYRDFIKKLEDIQKNKVLLQKERENSIQKAVDLSKARESQQQAYNEILQGKSPDQLYTEIAALNEQRLIASFQEHRKDLHPGHPCPLCGSPDHPFSTLENHTTSHEHLVNALKTRIKQAESSKTKIEELNQALTKTNHEAELIANRAASQEQSALSLTEQMEATKNSTQAAQTASKDLEAVLENLLKPYAVLIPPEGQEKKFQEMLEARKKEFQQNNVLINSLKTDLSKLSNQSQTLETERKLLDLHIAKIKKCVEDHEIHLVNTHKQKINHISTSWNSMEDALEAINVFEKALIIQKSSLGQQKEEYAKFHLQHSEFESKLSKDLQETSFVSVQGLRSANLPPSDVYKIQTVEEQIKARSDRLHGQLSHVENDLQNLLTNHVPQGEDLQAVQEKHRILESDTNHKRGTLAVSEKALTHDEAQRILYVFLQQEYENEKKQLMIWQKLAALIGSHDGKNFRQFAQGLSLDLLIKQANKHLSSLSDRYRLKRTVNDQLDLEIMDLHQANATRPTASLSGGESFLTSLALALGLSDLAGKNVRIDSLFIDEGFGSLDPETLEIAVHALESLRDKNKTIGVISHIELLKERISTQIIIEKGPGGISKMYVA